MQGWCVWNATRPNMRAYVMQGGTKFIEGAVSEKREVGQE